jgi:hypothetical protein
LPWSRCKANPSTTEKEKKMGQQQQTMESVAALRRIMLVVLVATLMALMIAANAGPALAKNSGTAGGEPPLYSGSAEGAEGDLTVDKGAGVQHCDSGGVIMRNKNFNLGNNC